MKKFILASALVAASLGAQAVTFTNVLINSAPFSNGASFATSGNSISFFTPNAVIDEGMPANSTILQIQYDANAGAGLTFSTVGAAVSAFQSGSGLVSFLERVFALDANGNELPGVIGTISNSSFANNQNFYGSTTLSVATQRIRVKKDILISAPNTSAARDLAALAIMNQNVQVVPEPATMTALGLGALALMRRRRAK